MTRLEEIRTPSDVYDFMESHIRYGWLDQNNEEHIDNMKNFRRLYRTSSIEETLEHRLGTCIEQVYLMKTLLDNIGIKSHMYCTRIYEGEDFDNLEESEHMHCFLLYEDEDRVYQIEHPNWERKGIYQFKSLEDGIETINKMYIELSGGVARPVTEFYEVPQGLNFKEFNLYINSLDKEKTK